MAYRLSLIAYRRLPEAWTAQHKEWEPAPYGESFFARFHSTYPEIESMRERAHFYKGTYALCEALHAVKDNDKEAFQNGIAEYI